MKRLSQIAAAALFFGCLPASAGTLTADPNPVVFADTEIGDTSTVLLKTFATFEGSEFEVFSFPAAFFSGLTIFSISPDTDCFNSAPVACEWTLSFTPTAAQLFTDTLHLRAIFRDRDTGQSEGEVFLAISGTGIASSEVPLPPAMALFATGLGALGVLGWRRKRKAVAG